MIKFIPIFVFLMTFFSNAYAITPTRVCDFGIKTFCERYEKTFIKDTGYYNNLFLNGSIEKFHSDDLLDGYIVPVGQDKGRSLVFFLNKEGYISSIAIFHENFGDQKHTSYTLLATLNVLGLRIADDEIGYFVNKLEYIVNEHKSVSKFIPSLKRYISLGYDRDLNFEKFIILAYTD